MLMQHNPKIIKGLSKRILVLWALSHCKEGRNDVMELDKADSGQAMNSPEKKKN